MSRIDYSHEAARSRQVEILHARRVRRTRRLQWMAIVVLLALMFLLGFAAGESAAATQEKPKFQAETIAERDCLELLIVRPAVMLPRTWSDLIVEARIARHPHHAMYSIAWDGGPAGAGSSAQTLHGEAEPYLHTRTIRTQPAAPWQFVAAVYDRRGKLVGRKTAAIVVPDP